MSESEELRKLGELHQSGVLSDEEFARAKARLLNGTAAAAISQPPIIAALNSLRRSRSDRWVSGVCGGLADATGMAAWLWRLAFALLVLCAGTGVLVYALMWIFVPEESVRLKSGMLAP
ncbi:PspC domain-containing protein [Ideonella sp.]|uniref:PspC domain-containing protein n=1 Tax=Ideonella sp. TaxID=1929293 RepID=UPI003BB76362